MDVKTEDLKPSIDPNGKSPLFNNNRIRNPIDLNGKSLLPTNNRNRDPIDPNGKPPLPPNFRSRRGLDFDVADGAASAAASPSAPPSASSAASTPVKRHNSGSSRETSDDLDDEDLEDDDDDDEYGNTRAYPSPSSISFVTNQLKRPWSQDEDDILKRAVHTYHGRNWKQVAELLPGRTHSQAAHRWQKVLDPKLRKGPWTMEEDDLLQLAVKEIGEGRWSRVAEQVGSRNGKQCRERWRNQISPQVDKRPWSKEEDNGIINFYNEFGPKWALIAQHFPGRTENAVKNRWNAKLGRPGSGSGGYSGNGAVSVLNLDKRDDTERTPQKRTAASPFFKGVTSTPGSAGSSSSAVQSRKKLKDDGSNPQMDVTQALLALKQSPRW